MSIPDFRNWYNWNMIGTRSSRSSRQVHWLTYLHVVSLSCARIWTIGPGQLWHLYKESLEFCQCHAAVWLVESKIKFFKMIGWWILTPPLLYLRWYNEYDLHFHLHSRKVNINMACNICGKDFARKDVLSHHLKRKRKYPCDRSKS